MPAGAALTGPTSSSSPCIPDYGGAWTGGIVPALLGTDDAGWLPAPVHEASAVVLLVIDGLGWHDVAETPALIPTIAALQGGPIHTVLPSTTAAGLTSITTGCTPAEHGLLGYRIRLGGKVHNVLKWDSKAMEPADAQPHAAFLGRRVPVVTRSEFDDTGFTTAHLRGTELSGWKTLAALIERVGRHVDGGAPFVYAYYDGLDKVAHEYGVDDDVHRRELGDVDRLVTDLLERLPATAALLVTADHGEVDIGPERAVGLEAVKPMVAVCSGEGRFRGLHARAGANADLLAAAEELYGGQAWVRCRDALFDEGWVGTGASALVRGRVGDVVLLARERVMFVDPKQKREHKMIAQHGSATAREVEVPLLGTHGRR